MYKCNKKTKPQDQDDNILRHLDKFTTLQYLKPKITRWLNINIHTYILHSSAFNNN